MDKGKETLLILCIIACATILPFLLIYVLTQSWIGGLIGLGSVQYIWDRMIK